MLLIVSRNQACDGYDVDFTSDDVDDFTIHFLAEPESDDAMLATAAIIEQRTLDQEFVVEILGEDDVTA